MKICYVCGARPNFVKIAALVRAADARGFSERLLVHTGQHYDERMSELFFEQLGIPRPDVDLGVGSGSQASQTAEIMRRFEPVLDSERPELVSVVGDTNSTVACALVAPKLRIPVAHVEVGLRSGDRDMPEEINRVITDSISDLLFVSEESGMRNLAHEGTPASICHFVGNVMIDTLLAHKEAADSSTILDRLAVAPQRYAALTLHRPSNVDDEETIGGIVRLVKDVSAVCPVVFPAHPRTRGRLSQFGLLESIERAPGIRLVPPLGYLDFVKLLANARLVLTDSGGVQEETTILRVPCLTLRTTTERPATVDAGTNTIVGANPLHIRAAIESVLIEGAGETSAPPLWDGLASQRIFAVLDGFADGRVPRR